MKAPGYAFAATNVVAKSLAYLDIYIFWLASCGFREKEKSLQHLPVATTDATRISDGGPYRDRTDDIHGVNVTLYQLS